MLFVLKMYSILRGLCLINKIIALSFNSTSLHHLELTEVNDYYRVPESSSVVAIVAKSTNRTHSYLIGCCYRTMTVFPPILLLFKSSLNENHYDSVKKM